MKPVWVYISNLDGSFNAVLKVVVDGWGIAFYEGRVESTIGEDGAEIKSLKELEEYGFVDPDYRADIDEAFRKKQEDEE